jgi:hypothetical protein
VFTLPWITNFFHVLFGALWLGGVFFAAFAVGPVLGRSVAAQREIGADFAMSAARYYRVVGTLAIVLGLVLAWIEGQRGWEAPAALILAIALFGWGEAVTKRHWMRLPEASDADRPALISRGIQLSMVENLGFLVLLAFMGLMRYGSP